MEQKDYGLVFAGGGGKGAYEIGVWKALRFLHMDTWIKGVSGASVGALNAALFSLDDYNNAERIWKNIHPIQFLGPAPDGVCSRDGLLKILRKELSLTQLSNSRIPAYISVARCPESTKSEMNFESAIACTDPEMEWEGEYVKINGKTPEEIEQLLLASSALPIVYDPVKIGSTYYRDGGLYDNLPMRPLLDAGLKNLILVQLAPDAEFDVMVASQADDLIVIKPSVSIGGLLTGTLDFDSANVMYRVHLGFYDTIRTFEFYERRLLGFPASAAEKQQRIEADLEKVQSLARLDNLSVSVERNKSIFEEIASKYGV